MSRNNAEIPKSYEDIVRKTVVAPDSSDRPTRQQEKEAREGFRALDTKESDLQGRVQQALASGGASSVMAEISDETVTLRGQVSDPAMLQTVEDVVARVPGVDTVHNLLVVGG